MKPVREKLNAPEIRRRIQHAVARLHGIYLVHIGLRPSDLSNADWDAASALYDSASGDVSRAANAAGFCPDDLLARMRGASWRAIHPSEVRT